MKFGGPSRPVSHPEALEPAGALALDPFLAVVAASEGRGVDGHRLALIAVGPCDAGHADRQEVNGGVVAEQIESGQERGEPGLGLLDHNHKRALNAGRAAIRAIVPGEQRHVRRLLSEGLLRPDGRRRRGREACLRVPSRLETKRGLGLLQGGWIQMGAGRAREKGLSPSPHEPGRAGTFTTGAGHVCVSPVGWCKPR